MIFIDAIGTILLQNFVDLALSKQKKFNVKDVMYGRITVKTHLMRKAEKAQNDLKAKIKNFLVEETLGTLDIFIISI